MIFSPERLSTTIPRRYQTVRDADGTMPYHVKPMAKSCAATNEPLQPGTVCISALVESEGRLTRLDYSEAGWSGPPPHTVGWWRATVPADDRKKDRPVDPDSLMRFFEQVAEESNAAQEKLLYVLALLLIQKRRLRLDGSVTRDDVDYIQLTGARGEGLFEVKDQQLTDEEIKQLESAVGLQLTQEWS